MNNNNFYRSNHMSAPMEHLLKQCNSYDEFEALCKHEMLSENVLIG